MSLRKTSGLAIFAVVCLLGEATGSAHAQCTLSSGAQCATEWSGGRVINLEALPGSTRISAAQDINDAGQIVGISFVGGQAYATEWRGGRVINLGGLPGFTGSEALGFGDYGLISVVILKDAGSDIEIDEYLMSCRVLQRGVEGFTMNNIFSYAARNGAKRVTGHYLPTKKNDMVKDFFKSFGIEKTADGEGGASQWRSPSTPMNELSGKRGYEWRRMESSRLTPIFRDVFNDDTLEVSESMTAADVPTWDSISNIDMIIAVEKAFGVKFSIKEFRNLKNVSELLELIKRKAA